MVRIAAGGFSFTAHFEAKAAPLTVAAFRKMLPYTNKIIHVRWSGEACWIPMGGLHTGVDFENATSYPSPGQIILYPGGVSETEILIAYGAVHFASKAGSLAGNFFLAIRDGLDDLATLGRRTLWEGAQDIAFTAIDE